MRSLTGGEWLRVFRVKNDATCNDYQLRILRVAG
jgi:hypothetical protein